MQPWQTKALELEMSALNHLDGFMRAHALYFFMGAIYLLLALLVWILRSALLRKATTPSRSYVQPVIFFPLPGTPSPPPEPFEPPLRECDCDYDPDDWPE